MARTSRGLLQREPCLKINTWELPLMKLVRHSWTAYSASLPNLPYLDINAKFPPGVLRLLHKIFNRPIETALGYSLFLQTRARTCTIEWLLSNGAKFSENETTWIENSPDTENLKKVLEATRTKYSTFKNTTNEANPLDLIGRTFKQLTVSNRTHPRVVIKPNNEFSYHGNILSLFHLQDMNIDVICRKRRI